MLNVSFTHSQNTAKTVQLGFIPYGHILKHLRVCLIILEGLSETPAQLESVFISINVSVIAFLHCLGIKTESQ